MEVTQIVSNGFVSVSVDLVRQVVRVTRSSERGSIVQITRAFADAVAALDGIGRARLGLLVDLRAAPGRNDPDFENAMAKQRVELLRGFAALAILVQTATGQLQVSRIGREDGMDVAIFTDEFAALAWLEGARASG
ncbi:MAG TPA: hypothetical protein VFQ35_11095 [Polyangiaceae bacterium]|nr:hypothetical protein [Polyangiaceae bacterium]